jgi:hypothetical protein
LRSQRHRGEPFRRSRARAAVGALALGAVSAVALGCSSDRDVYPMRGQAYDPDGDCLAASDVIDVVEGPAPDPCDGYRCLRSAESGDLFVTAHCGAPPGWSEEAPDAGTECEAALAAKARGDDGLCPPAS